MFQFLFHSSMMSHSTPKRGASRTRSFRGDGADHGEEVTEESIIEGTQDRTEHESDDNVFAWEEYDPDNHNMIHSSSSSCTEHDDITLLERRQDACESERNDLEKQQRLLASVVEDAQDRLDARLVYMRTMVDEWYQRHQQKIQQYRIDATSHFKNRIAHLDQELDKVKAERELLIKSCMTHDSGAYCDMSELSDSENNSTPSEQPQTCAAHKEHTTLVMSRGRDMTDSLLGTFHIHHTHTPVCDNSLLTECRQSINPRCSHIDSPYTILDTARILSTFNARLPHHPYPYTATGLSLNKDGSLLVTDIGCETVSVYTLSGELIRIVTTVPQDYPTKAVFIGDYIAVVCEHAVKLYNKSSTEFVGYVEDDSLDSPRAITVGRNEHLIVADVRDRGSVIEQYKLENHADNNNGTTVKTIITDNTIIGGKRAPSISQPRYMCTDRDNKLYVSDYADHAIKVFTSRGILVQEIGCYGAGIGQFCRPGGVCVDRLGNIVVADCMNHRVQLYMLGADQWTVLLTTDVDDYPVDLTIRDTDESLIILHSNGRVTSYKYLWDTFEHE